MSTNLLETGIVLYFIPFLISFSAILIGNYVWNYVNRPRLTLEINEKPHRFYVSGQNIGEPISLLMPWYLSEDEQDQYDSSSYIYNVSITNQGKTPAKGASAYLQLNSGKLKGKMFILKWNSIPEPYEYKRSNDGKYTRELLHEQLANSNQKLDILPCIDCRELLGVVVHMSYLTAYDDGPQLSGFTLRESAVVFSPTYYYKGQIAGVEIEDDEVRCTVIISHESGMKKFPLLLQGIHSYGKLKIKMHNGSD